MTFDRAWFLFLAFCIGYFTTNVVQIFLASRPTIVPHPTGEAVYIGGQGCTINLEDHHRNVMEMNRRWIWCWDEHQKWLNKQVE